MSQNHILGILGGLGPMTSAYLYEMIVTHTCAGSDQDHIDIYISSRASTPDRTEFILGRSDRDPAEVMSVELKKLVAAGADVIAIPCNTSHYFYDRLTAGLDAIVINMVEATVAVCKKKNVKKLGLLATEGTVGTGIYDKACRKFGIECFVPDKEIQKIVSAIIYDQIKANKPANAADMETVSEYLKKAGCDAAVLGCTELSVAKKQLGLGKWYVSSLEVLAKAAIEACGKQSIGFEELE